MSAPSALLRCPVNHTLAERVSRGNRMQKGLRNQWEPWIWELLTAASGDGVGDKLGNGAGGRDTLFSALAPVCPSRVSFRSLRTSASLCHTPWEGWRVPLTGTCPRGSAQPWDTSPVPEGDASAGGVLQGSGTARRRAARWRPRGPSATTAAVPWSPPARPSCSRSPRPAWTRATVCSLPTVKW